jgi:hypothetical protein
MAIFGGGSMSHEEWEKDKEIRAMRRGCEDAGIDFPMEYFRYEGKLYVIVGTDSIKYVRKLERKISALRHKLFK